MDYKIVEKEAFTVIGISKVFKYENAFVEIPKYWEEEYYKNGKKEVICGMYGINMDIQMKGNEFEYMIADNYNPILEIPEGIITKVIPKHTWAVFPCIGPSSKMVAEINQKIFKEWLPNCRNYEIAEGYNIEMYTDPQNYQKGVQDEKYYGEIWIPIKKK